MAGEQQKAARNQLQLAERINKQNTELFQPFYDAGVGSLSKSMDLINNQGKYFNEIAKSPEFAALNNAATRNVMAQSEATGGTGNTVNHKQTANNSANAYTANVPRQG